MQLERTVISYNATISATGKDLGPEDWISSFCLFNELRETWWIIDGFCCSMKRCFYSSNIRYCGIERGSNQIWLQHRNPKSMLFLAGGNASCCFWKALVTTQLHHNFPKEMAQKSRFSKDGSLESTIISTNSALSACERSDECLGGLGLSGLFACYLCLKSYRKFGFCSWKTEKKWTETPKTWWHQQKSILEEDIGGILIHYISFTCFCWVFSPPRSHFKV